MICAPSGATRAHQSQTGAAKQRIVCGANGVLSPGGTRLAPTEAERRPAVCARNVRATKTKNAQEDI